MLVLSSIDQIVAVEELLIRIFVESIYKPKEKNQGCSLVTQIIEFDRAT